MHFKIAAALLLVLLIGCDIYPCGASLGTSAYPEFVPVRPVSVVKLAVGDSIAVDVRSFWERRPELRESCEARGASVPTVEWASASNGAVEVRAEGSVVQIKALGGAQEARVQVASKDLHFGTAADTYRLSESVEFDVRIGETIPDPSLPTGMLSERAYAFRGVRLVVDTTDANADFLVGETSWQSSTDDFPRLAWIKSGREPCCANRHYELAEAYVSDRLTLDVLASGEVSGYVRTGDESPGGVGLVYRVAIPAAGSSVAR